MRLSRLKWWLPLSFSVVGVAQDCPAILGRAQQAFDARQFPVAAAELEAALARCPADRVRVQVALGQTQYLLGKDDDAERAFLAAVAVDPNHEEALYALGRIYSMKDRLAEAVAKFEAVLRLNPKNYKAWDNLGVCFDGLDRGPEALRAFFKALDLVMKDHPEYDWAHANLADYFLRRDENEKAFQLAAEAAERNPNSARNCFLTGKALVRLGKRDLSLRWLERAVQLDPDYADALYLLSQTYRVLGRSEESERMLVRFKEASKSRPPRR